MSEYNKDDIPWGESPNKESNYSFSQFEQDCERESNEEISKPLDASLKPTRLNLPPPDAEAGERECGALWTQKGSHGQRFNGDIIIEGSKYKISVLPNLNRKKHNSPTFRIFWH